MKPCACHLTAGIQALNAGLGVYVGDHSSTGVMRSRYNRYRFLCHVKTEGKTFFINVRKPLLYKSSTLVGYIEEYAVIPAPLHLCIYGPCHYIPRRQIRHWVVTRHKCCPVLHPQDRSLTAHSLRYKERLCRRMKQARRMELDELHV